MTESIVFLYPGQSVQKVGLGLDEHHGVVEDFFLTADRVLGFSLSELCFNGPEETLNQDLNCQLAIYVYSCALTEILRTNHISASVYSGYSSGFYAAAYAAGCYDFIYGLNIVRQAGQLLWDQRARVNGAMGAIFGLTPEAVAALCDEIGHIQPAIYNTPRQVIVSGPKKQVDAAIEAAMAADALDAYRLPATTAYHSPLMKEAGDKLRQWINMDKLSAPNNPLISYSSLRPVRDAQDLVQVLADQLSAPVRWVELIQMLSRKGVRQAVEVGPGKVISRSARWIDRGFSVLSTDTNAALDTAVRQIQSNADEIKLGLKSGFESVSEPAIGDKAHGSAIDGSK